jgi:ubiquinone/menaquinone biosynthesis C-methylase UbiE
VPNFVDRARLTAVEADIQAEYDRVADGIYDVAVDWQFAALYEDEDAVRESLVDMLELSPGAQVLEIGCGTGRDSFRLARRLGTAGRLHMQDLSSGMVHACVRKMSALANTTSFACDLDYSVSSATSLPFPDGLFDAVFHFGGFNQFGDLKKGAAELARVAKPGGRVVFGDEAVAPWLRRTEFEAIVTTNNPLFEAEVPLGVLPVGARDVVVRWILGNCFYVIAFRKGDGPPRLNLDLPHRGWRGGTMRTRYFGVLEGVTVEAKALAREAAAKAGVSVHEWLDRLVKDSAARVLGTSNPDHVKRSS